MVNELKEKCLYKVNTVFLGDKESSFEVIYIKKIIKKSNTFVMLAKTVKFLYPVSKGDEDLLSDWNTTVKNEDLKYFEYMGTEEDYPEYFI